MFGSLPLVFDSDALPERDRFGFAREEYGRKALKVDFELLKNAPLRLKMRGDTYGDVRVAVIDSTPYRVRRTRSLIDDGDDKIGLIFPLSGRFGGEQLSRDITVGRGQATIMLADRTGWFGTPSGGSFLTIRVSPELIKSYAPDRNCMKTGLSVKPSQLGLRLVRAYLLELSRSREAMPAEFRQVCGRHLAELAAHAFSGGASESGGASDGEGLRAGRLSAALAHIAAHFAEPDYSIAACASALGLSVRYLQKILEAHEISFSEEVRRLRMEHVRRLLADPAAADLRITDIAFDAGFSDISHFNRQFRIYFGDTPTGMRGHKSG